MTQQKNKKAGSKMEPNYIPEIPDREGGGDIRHPRPPFGGSGKGEVHAIRLAPSKKIM